MTFARAAVGGTLAWLGLITLLHVFVNLGGFAAFKKQKNFKVGFLPVT